MNKFELIAGRHYDRAQRLFEPGDTVISADDLVRSFPNKFKLIGPATPDEVTKYNAKKGKGTVAPKPTQPEPEVKQDVSTNFPEATETAVVVYKLGEVYSVVDPESPDVNLNKKPLTRDGVTRFLREYAKGDE